MTVTRRKFTGDRLPGHAGRILLRGAKGRHDRRIGSALQPKHHFIDALERLPHTQLAEHRVEHIGHRAIVAGFQPTVMMRMVALGLQHADFLQKCDERAVLARVAMRPFVNLGWR